MKSAPHFHVFDTWLNAPSYAFGRMGQKGIVPQNDKDAYWDIYSELHDAANNSISLRDDQEHLFLRPKQYSKDRGSRGHRPVDLWVSICAAGSDKLGFMPQVYIIASKRGVEVGFAASIAEDDYFDPEVKARNRTTVPFINAKLPSPSDESSLKLQGALDQQGGWHFNLKTRLTYQDDGFDKFTSLSDLLTFLKTSDMNSGGGCICRIYPRDQLDSIDLAEQAQLALDNFAPLLAACSPTPWDVQIRQGQIAVEKFAKHVPFDPTGLADGRKRGGPTS